MTALLEAQSYRNSGQVQFVAEADLASGKILQSSDGRAIVVAGLNADALKEGQKVAAETWGVFLVRKAAALAFASGDRVYWDDTAKEAKASGDFCLGVAIAPASADADWVVVDFNAQGGDVGLLEAIVAASDTITNTTTETAFSNGTHVFAADSLRVGDVIRVKAQTLALATNGSDTLTLKLKIGSTAIIATAAVDVANNDIGYIAADIVIRTLGATGTFVASGVQALGVPGTVTAKPFSKSSTTIDTTAAQTVSLTATWSAASTGNQVQLDHFSVELLRK